MTRIYISLPISGRKKEDYTLQSDLAKKFLAIYDLTPVSPLDNGLPTEAPVSEHMKKDYKLLLECDAIYLCHGWEYSHGCMNELQVAADCRLAVLTDSMNIDEIKRRLRTHNARTQKESEVER